MRSINLGTIKVRDVDWAGDEYIVVTASQTERMGRGFAANKGEFMQVFIHSLLKDEDAWVFEKQARIANAIFGRYGLRKIDNRWSGYFGGMALEIDNKLRSNRTTTYRERVFKIDLDTKSDSLVDEQTSDFRAYSDWVLEENGQVAAKLNFNTENGKWEIENAKGKTITNGMIKRGNLSLIALGKDGDTVIFQQVDNSINSQKIFEIPLSGGEKKRVFTDQAIASWFIDKSTNRLIGYRRKNGHNRSVFLDSERNKLAAKIRSAFSKVNVDIIDWNDEFSRVIVFTNGNADAGSWWSIDLKAFKAELLGSSYPAIQGQQVGKITTFAYQAQDGLNLDGILTLPPGRKPEKLPIIVFPHGGPHSHDEAEFNWWAQAFASRGYAVFQPNFRGSTNKDVKFRNASEGEWGRKMQSDISDGLQALVSLGIADGDRACIMGGSYGGYAALAGVTVQQGLYRCAVSFAGISDLSLLVETERKESGNSRGLRRALFAELGKGRDLKEVSPIKFAERADAPILLIHGNDDTVVNINQSKAMADALKDAKKPFDFIRLKGEDHWLSSGDTRLKMLEAAVSFTLRHNPPD
ncbi:alpha/beta hydrolase family protein [Sphingorhabdus sp. Alg231-15]|uniref:alpha/beta hydrolase family protein n=1 Tax=Sphingorhabdus sp. Alg231-15 TaxID=1922222 RepID=UPI00307C6640